MFSGVSRGHWMLSPLSFSECQPDEIHERDNASEAAVGCRGLTTDAVDAYAPIPFWRGAVVSRINTRNYQLGLAFNDGDMRKPKHDEIMHWLSAWVKNVDNVRSFIGSKKVPRQILTDHRLSPEAREAINAVPEGERRSIWLSFQNQFPDGEIDTSQEWPDEPPSTIKFIKYQWELPLRNARGGEVGFCDLCADYEVTSLLEKIDVLLYSATPRPTSRYPSFKFEQCGSRQEWRQQSGQMRLFFEVKTEIPSVGELMRQLQLYRGTETARGFWTHFAVVAPPNNEAASVCADHGISFVQYRPRDE